MSEQPQKQAPQPKSAEQLEYEIIKAVGLQTAKIQELTKLCQELDGYVVELSKDAKPGTLDRLGLAHLKQYNKPEPILAPIPAPSKKAKEAKEAK